MANKKYVCIICPNSCEIAVEYSGKDITRITGQGCKKGEEYVRKELTSPERGITTSVPVKEEPSHSSASEHHSQYQKTCYHRQ